MILVVQGDRQICFTRSPTSEQLTEFLQGKTPDYQGDPENLPDVIRTRFLPSPQTSWDGFRRWRYTNTHYKALIRLEPGLMKALDEAIANQEYKIAQSLWEDLKNLGAITPQLGAALAEAAVEFNLPDEIKSALA